MTETRHGFVCANSGVDLSNVAEGWAALLPEDPDRSARRLRDGIRARTGLEVAVVISDTFGRAWRRGVTDVAIGCAGIRAVVDLRGTTDALGPRARRDRDLRRGRSCRGRRARHGEGEGRPGGRGQGSGRGDARGRGPSPKRWSAPTARTCSGDGRRRACRSDCGDGSLTEDRVDQASRRFRRPSSRGRAHRSRPLLHRSCRRTGRTRGGRAARLCGGPQRPRRPAVAAGALGLTVRTWRAPTRLVNAVWARADLPPIEWLVGPIDVLHGTNYVVPPARNAGRVVTVYDLTALRYPKFCAPASLAYPRLVARSVRQGAFVHVLSSFVRDEVIDLLGVGPDRVRVVPPGLDAPSKSSSARSTAPVGRRESTPYLLALGAVEPRRTCRHW